MTVCRACLVIREAYDDFQFRVAELRVELGLGIAFGDVDRRDGKQADLADNASLPKPRRHPGSDAELDQFDQDLIGRTITQVVGYIEFERQEETVVFPHFHAIDAESHRVVDGIESHLDPISAPRFWNDAGAIKRRPLVDLHSLLFVLGWDLDGKPSDGGLLRQRVPGPPCALPGPLA